MTYPILAQNGRDIIGYAKCAASAKRKLHKILPTESITLTKRHGFALSTWLREDWIVALNGGLKGWMYSIGK